jgi:hypothetical protein
VEQNPAQLVVFAGKTFFKHPYSIVLLLRSISFVADSFVVFHASGSLCQWVTYIVLLRLSLPYAPSPT